MTSTPSGFTKRFSSSFELDDTVVDTGPAGCLHLAVVAQEPVAGLV